MQNTFTGTLNSISARNMVDLYTQVVEMAVTALNHTQVESNTEQGHKKSIQQQQEAMVELRRIWTVEMERLLLEQYKAGGLP